MRVFALDPTRWMELRHPYDGRIAYNEQQVTSVAGAPAAGEGAQPAAGKVPAWQGCTRMFERYTERARRVLFFARYEASQLGSVSIETEHLLLGLIREGKGLTSRIFQRSHLSLESIRKEIEGRTVFREKVSTSVEIPFSARDQAGPAVRRRGSRPAPPQLHRHRAPAARHPARGALRRRLHPDGEGDAAEHGARGHRAAAQREDHADAGQGNAAARRVQPRPDRGGDEEPARPAGRPRARDRARAAGALPPHQEQRRPHRRARRRQDRHRRGPGRRRSSTATCRTSWPTSACSRSTSR